MKLDLCHVCGFECKTYIHIPKHENSRLHPCAFEGIMVGYDEQIKNFKWYHLQKRIIMLNNNVTFYKIMFCEQSFQVSNLQHFEVINEISFHDIKEH